METDIGQITDGALVAQVSAGDRAALAALYDRYAGALFAAARRFLPEPRDAEDLLHDLFLEVWKKAGTYDPARASVRTWLLIRLRSRAMDRRKSAHATRLVSLEAQPPRHQVEAQSSGPTQEADQESLRRALEALPQAQRDVLEMSYFQGLSSSEIAASLSIPVGTVKSRAAAGMRQLRRALCEELEGAP